MKKIKIIIPCYNEEESLPQLFSKLEELNKSLTNQYLFHYLFVDDGSNDNTLSMLNEYCQQGQNASVLKHTVNQNLGAALKTGIFNDNPPDKECDYFVFLDSDCTYEPQIVLKLLSEIEKGNDLVTVSPYHPEGDVEGVPEWRLLLSKGLTLIYRIILGTGFFTYTAMVRVIDSKKIAAINSDSNDFSFVAEMFIKAIRKGYRISEVPTTLHVRKYGQSKMNVLKTIRSHLKIIKKLLFGNLD